jgi:hypothetical protein
MTNGAVDMGGRQSASGQTEKNSHLTEIYVFKVRMTVQRG